MKPNKRLLGAKEAVAIAKGLIQDWNKEHAIGVYLDAENYIKKVELIGMGTLNAQLIHPREVYRTAISFSCAGVVLLHNHPSGRLIPSKDDIAITNQMKQAGDILSIPLLDHIIFCKGSNYYSFVANKKM